MLTIRGRLARGLGQAAAFTQLPWVVEQCREKLGFEPYPGTVNLELLPEDLTAWRELQSQPGITLTAPDAAFCDARCHNAKVANLRAAAILPHVAGYPQNKLELLAAVPVMERLGLRLGDLVTVDFD